MRKIDIRPEVFKKKIRICYFILSCDFNTMVPGRINVEYMLCTILS